MFWSIILVPLDYLTVLLALLASYFLRSQSLITDIRPVISSIPFPQYFGWSLVMSVLWVVVFALSGLYNLKRREYFFGEVGKIFVATTAAIALVIVLIFFRRDWFSSRFIILAIWGLSFVFIVVERLIIHYLKRWSYKKGKGVKRIILVGGGEAGKYIARDFSFHPQLGYRVVDELPDFTEFTEKHLAKFLETHEIDEIIQTRNLNIDDNVALIDFCNERHLTFRYVADYIGAQFSRIDITTLAGLPIVEMKRTSLEGWGRIYKRFFDIIFSILVLIILSPIFLIVAIVIKVDTRGPVFVGLSRVGKRGRIFKCWKFRSMVNNAHELKKELMKYNERADGPLFKMTNDPRITRVGRFIRRTSVDELPNFVNVLLGKMSVVGPRPHEPEEVAKYQKHHKKLLAIKPGISGLAQVSGRSNLNFEEEARLDIYYVENWSLWKDIEIIIRTLFVVIGRRNVS